MELKLKLKTVDVSNCSDNELIELSAVAIGYDRICSWKDQNVYSSYSGAIFNPLTDWNTAMLLVTTLELACSAGTNKFVDNLDLADLASGAEYIVGDCSYWVYTTVEYVKSNRDGDQALRRAITTLAAKIGKIKLEVKTDV